MIGWKLLLLFNGVVFLWHTADYFLGEGQSLGWAFGSAMGVGMCLMGMDRERDIAERQSHRETAAEVADEMQDCIHCKDITRYMADHLKDDHRWSSKITIIGHPPTDDR